LRKRFTGGIFIFFEEFEDLVSACDDDAEIAGENRIIVHDGAIAELWLHEESIKEAQIGRELCQPRQETACAYWGRGEASATDFPAKCLGRKGSSQPRLLTVMYVTFSRFGNRGAENDS
jgi:hypothetical protein